MAKTVSLIDTCIFIEVLHGNKRIAYFLKRKEKFFYSSITKKELFKKRGISNSQKLAIKELLYHGKLLHIDETILETVRILAPIYYKKNIHDSNDIIIAATAISKNLPLATLNRKHFSFIKGLKLVHLG